MKNYDFFQKKYLEKDEYSLDEDTQWSLVHLRRMDNEQDYREAIEARLYRQKGWEELWNKFGLSI